MQGLDWFGLVWDGLAGAVICRIIIMDNSINQSMNELAGRGYVAFG